MLHLLFCQEPCECHNVYVDLLCACPSQGLTTVRAVARHLACFQLNLRSKEDFGSVGQNLTDKSVTSLCLGWMAKGRRVCQRIVSVFAGEWNEQAGTVQERLRRYTRSGRLGGVFKREPRALPKMFPVKPSSGLALGYAAPRSIKYRVFVSAHAKHSTPRLCVTGRTREESESMATGQNISRQRPKLI